MKAPQRSAAEQAREESNSTILLAYLDAEGRQRDTWGRQVFPILRAEVSRRGLDLRDGRTLLALQNQARAADQRGQAAYDHQGVNAAGPNGAIASSMTLAERLWTEAKQLEQEIDAR